MNVLATYIKELFTVVFNGTTLVLSTRIDEHDVAEIENTCVKRRK